MTLPLPEGTFFCAICATHRVQLATHYVCPCCDGEGYTPTTRPMTVPLTRTPLTAVERLWRGLP